MGGDSRSISHICDSTAPSERRPAEHLEQSRLLLTGICRVRFPRQPRPPQVILYFRLKKTIQSGAISSCVNSSPLFFPSAALGFIEPGAGARECVAGEPYSAKCCIRRSVSNAPYPGNSCLAGARQRYQHPPPHLQLLLAFSEGSPRTTENCLLLRQQVAHTSSGLSFEKTDCEGSPRLGRPYFQVGALATVEEAGESLKPQAGGIPMMRRLSGPRGWERRAREVGGCPPPSCSLGSLQVTESPCDEAGKAFRASPPGCL